jgi:ribosomal-protein-alanine N-acetyltransferase
MNSKENPLLPKIVEDLRRHDRCHTAILYGSRARGDATPTSDYDILGVRAEGPIERDARLWSGVYLDLFFYPEKKLLEPDESMLHLLDGRVLFEKDNLGTRFLERLQAIFAAGPKALPPDEVNSRRVWAWKMLERARIGDSEGHFRRHWLLEALLEDFFRLRNKWYRGPKESFRYLKAEESIAFEAFEAALKPSASLEDIENLVFMVTQERHGRHFVPKLETSRLILTPVSIDDAPAYQEHFLDYEVIRHLSAQVPWPYPENGIVEFFSNIILPPQGTDRWTWVIRLKTIPNEIIGCVDLWREGRPEHRGFWLGKKFWGQGYMTEAVSPVTDYAFSSLGFETLTFTNAVGNDRSRRVKEKTGARLIGIKPAAFVDPQYTEHEIWELSKTEWLRFKEQQAN